LTAPSSYQAGMKVLFDLFPIILFFVAFKFGGIYVATSVAIVATFGQIGWLKMRGRKVDTMMWVSLGIIVVFGGATLLLHDETFIKWKPTVLYWFFAVSLAGANLFLKKNIIKGLLMGALNLYVAFNYPLDTWVNFKLFGGMGLMFVFVMAQALFLAKHMPEHGTTDSDSASPPGKNAGHDAGDHP
jgi:intracellular septation protein